MKIAVIALIVIAFSSSANEQSTGYPACDKYISMVSACIKTKMPQEARAEEQQRLDAFRDMLVNSFLGPRAAESCELNIRLEIQRDRHGCYAKEAAAAGVRTPCSLVTAAELGTILGASLEQGRPGNSACEYDSARTPGLGVRLEVAWSDGRDQMDAWRGGVDQVREQVRKTLGQSAPVSGETVKGVGDDAFFVVAGFTPMISARKGDVAVSVRAQGATRDQLIAILRSALQRIP
jgi:hypothetical protein